MNWRYACMAIPLLIAACAGSAPDPAESSALVTMQVVWPGVMPDLVTAYGTAAPAPNGAMTLSVQAESRVTRVMARAGDVVRKGEPLLTFDLSGAATSAYAQAQIAVQTAESERARLARMLDQHLATREQKAQADKTAADAHAALQALVRDAANQPHQTLLAPFDGVVGAVSVAQGDRLAPGAPMVSVTQRGGLVVTVGVEPSDARRVHVGQQAKVQALGEDAQLSGVVVRVGSALNPQTRLIDAELAVQQALVQGAAYRTWIHVGDIKGWLVPRDAVLDDDRGSHVFQIAGHRAERVAVTRLGGDATTIIVDGRLKGLPIAVSGSHQLENGTLVRPYTGDAVPTGGPSP